MLTLRKATLADSGLLLRWRNDLEAIAMSTTSRAVTEAEHDRWFVKTLTDITVHLYVAEDPIDYGPSQPWLPVGMGRINEERGVAILSYSVDANYRGQGYGGELVAALTAKAYELGFTSIQAVVRHANTASIRALLGQGYEIDPHELLRLTKEKDR
jgi:RimJ/RimL family protein N-acetyltransferase